MEIVQFIPGVIVSPNAVTLPTGAPDLEAVVEVVIARLQSALGAHVGAGVDPPHATTAVPVTHAGAAVAQHAAHAHDLVSQGVAGAPGVALGWDNVVPTQMEDAGAAALHTFTANNITGCMNANMDAHVVTQPNDHPAADIVAAIDDHAAVDLVAALAAHVAADIEVAMTATRISPRTFSLNLDTQVADVVILTYHEAGDRVLVA